MKGVLHIVEDEMESVYTVDGAEEFLTQYAAFDAWCADQTEREE